MEPLLIIVTGFVTALFGVLTKVLIDERKAAEAARLMHAECMDEHAATREQMGGFREVARIFARHQPEARDQVHQALANADARASEVKSDAKRASGGPER